MAPGTKQALSDVSCISQNDHKVVFEAFKPVTHQPGGWRGVKEDTEDCGRRAAPRGAQALLQRAEPFSYLECCITELYTLCSNWLQLVIEDTNTGKMNLVVEVGLVASSWGTVSGRGHRGGCWGEAVSLCVLTWYINE